MRILKCICTVLCEYAGYVGTIPLDRKLWGMDVYWAHYYGINS